MRVEKPANVALDRRAVLTAPFVAGLAWLLRPRKRAHAAGQKATLLAKAVDRVPEDPDDPLWQQADLLEIPLAPQAVVKPRAYEAGIKGVTVRALYDADRLGFLVSWADASQDLVIGGTWAFRDAIAIEFPAVPSAGIPYFGMGEPDKPVTIYQWKADWQFAREGDEDELHPNMAVDWYPFSGRPPGEIAEPADYGAEGGEKVFQTSWGAGSPLGNLDLQAQTPVEKLEAEGFGTLSSAPPQRQDGLGNGAWKDGRWKAVIAFPRAQDRFTFERGMTVPVAFAAWDGSKRERGGEKGVSTWYFLSLEQPVGAMTYVGPVLAFVGAAAVQGWVLRALRRRRRQADEERG